MKFKTSRKLGAMLFTSLGQFILDDIHCDEWSRYNVIGGGGTYALLGSLMVNPDPATSCMFIDLGYDCPPTVREEIESWHSGSVVRDSGARRTTHGVNTYKDGLRLFEYTGDKIPITRDDISQWPDVAHSRSFHVLCSPERCRDLIAGLDAILCWEPTPDSCVPMNLGPISELLHKIDVFSPNADELAALMGVPAPVTLNDCTALAAAFHPHLTQRCALVLRCGAHGAVLCGTSGAPPVTIGAYHNSAKENFHAHVVVDPTGCGNTFMGAMTTALALGNDLHTACRWGSVASGVCIEDYGVPKLHHGKWNGVSMSDRFKGFN